MKKINKAIWLSYDLGIGGDYPGLYKWLDNHKAKECGNSIAFFRYSVESSQLDKLKNIIFEDLDKSVTLRPGDRLYIVYRETNVAGANVRGHFIFGHRRSNPWEGYGDNEKSTTDIGE